jgi:hypothetical protein
MNIESGQLRYIDPLPHEDEHDHATLLVSVGDDGLFNTRVPLGLSEVWRNAMLTGLISIRARYNANRGRR